MRIRFSFFIFIISLLVCGTAKAQFTYQYLEVLYDSAWTYKNLQLVPIRFKAGRGGGGGKYLSLSDGMAQKKVFVKELPSKTGADKGTVMITNKSKQTILIKSGDMIGGGKQDRILTKTALIPPGQKREFVSVFCVEKERWDAKPRSFFYGGSGDVELRKTIDVHRSQASVWKEIDRQYLLNNQSSKTWSYLKLKNDSTRNDEYAKFFRKKLDDSNGGFAGFVFIIGTQIMSVELFSKSDYTRTCFNDMLATYIKSVGNTINLPMVSPGRQKTFLDNVLISREAQFKLIRKQGVAHRQDGELLHIVVYGTNF